MNSSNRIQVVRDRHYRLRSAYLLLHFLVFACITFGGTAKVFAADTSTPPLTVSTADSASPNDTAEIEQLTDRLLRKGIDFERYYTQYRMIGSKEPKSRYLRYFILQQTAAALLLASTLLGITEPGKHLRSPEEVSENVLKNSSRLGLIGICFEGGSSAFELGSNALLAMKNKKRKTDPGTARKEAINRLKEIDAIAQRRNELIARNRGKPEYEIWKCEGRLLRSFRDLAVYEFIDLYADIRSYQSSNNVYYILDAGASSAYLASYILGLKGFERPNLYKSSSITGMVGDSLGIASAPACTWSYNKIYDFWAARVSKQMKEQPVDTENIAKDEMHALEGLLAGCSDKNLASLGPIATRLQVYKLWSHRYDRFVEKQMIDLRHSSKVALQSNISGPLISGAFLNQDIMGTISAYRYANNPRVQNNMFFASSIPATTASVANIMLTTYWYIDNKRHHEYLKKQNALPEELMSGRLKTLEEIEHLISQPISQYPPLRLPPSN